MVCGIPQKFKSTVYILENFQYILLRGIEWQSLWIIKSPRIDGLWFKDPWFSSSKILLWENKTLETQRENLPGLDSYWVCGVMTSLVDSPGGICLATCNSALDIKGFGMGVNRDAGLDKIRETEESQDISAVSVVPTFWLLGTAIYWASCYLEEYRTVKRQNGTFSYFMPPSYSPKWLGGRIAVTAKATHLEVNWV